MLRNYLMDNKLEVKILIIMTMLGVVTAFAYSKLKARENSIDMEVKYHTDKAFPNLGIIDYEKKTDLFSHIQKGKFLLVYVLSGCSGCKLEAQILQNSNLSEKTGIKVLLMSSENADSLINFEKEFNLNVPIFYDEQYKLKERFDINATPANYLIVNGKVERSWMGSPVTKKDLYEKIGLSAP